MKINSSKCVNVQCNIDVQLFKGCLMYLVCCFFIYIKLLKIKY